MSRLAHRRASLPVVVAVAVVAITLGIGGGWGLSSMDPPGSADPSDSAAVVRAYLEAVAAGDADRALALGVSQPPDHTLMTNDVLERVNAIAPMTDIHVPETTATLVPASYLMGSQRVNVEIPVAQTSDGPRLQQTWGLLRLRSPSGTEDLPRMVHGVIVTADDTPVFPGVYPVETGRTLLDWGPQATGVVTRPGAFTANDPVLRPALTDAGTERFAAATRRYLEDCLASVTLTPAGCPFEASTSQTPDSGSISWSLDEDPMARFDPRVDYDNPHMATAHLSFSVQAHWRVDGNSRNLSFFVSGRALFDLSDDQQPRFTWRD